MDATGTIETTALTCELIGIFRPTRTAGKDTNRRRKRLASRKICMDERTGLTDRQVTPCTSDEEQLPSSQSSIQCS